jgi:hypothetical protein
VSPQARALAQALLDHHQSVRRSRSDQNANIDSCLISYGDLCENAALPCLKAASGKFLREIAQWCHENGWPPLNALAVNYRTRKPGHGYADAPGCSLAHWRDEAEAAIDFDGYPDVAP